MMPAIAAEKETRIGPYVLKRVLGKGGSGQAYLAWRDNPTGQPLPCVVKFPLHSHATDGYGKHHVWREARLAMRLGPHAHIAYVFDAGLHEGCMPYLAMEYVDGVDLGTLLSITRRQRRPLSAASIYVILVSIASGLHHAHSARTIDKEPVQIVHRDVTPANILVNQGGVVKLLDFGIGVAMAEGTTGNHLRGTYRYMSPEHLDGKVCPEMDIYALGVVAWEMAENRVFREGCEGISHMPAIMDGAIPEMRHEDSQLVRIIMSCLSRHARHRPNAAELTEALTRWAKAKGYDRDPSVLEQELAPIMGSHRPSGASQENLAAPPELIATLAAVQQAATGPEPVAKPTPYSPRWEIVAGRRRELDAPRVYRRRKGSPLDPDEGGVAELQGMSEVLHSAAHAGASLPSTAPRSEDPPAEPDPAIESIEPPTSPTSSTDRPPEATATPHRAGSTSQPESSSPAPKPGPPSTIVEVEPPSTPKLGLPTLRMPTPRVMARVVVVALIVLLTLLIIGWLNACVDDPRRGETATDQDARTGEPERSAH